MLYERYYKKAYHVAYGVLRDRDESHDAVQEAFLALIDRPSFPHYKNFWGLLKVITRNIAIDIIRKKNPKSVTAFILFDPFPTDEFEDAEEEVITTSDNDEWEELISRIEREEKMAQLESKIAQIAFPKMMGVFVFFIYANQSLEKVAAILGYGSRQVERIKAEIKKIMKEVFGSK